MVGGLRAPEAQIPVDLELVLAVDVSGSIDAEEFRLQREGYAAAFRDPEVIAAIQNGILGAIAVTYFEWSSAPQQATIVKWTLVRDIEDAEVVAETILAAPRPFSARTSISGAIRYALRGFAKSGFEGTRQVLDISGDGVNNHGGSVTDARDAALAAGIIVNGLVILEPPGRQAPWMREPLDEYFRENVIGGPGAFVEVVTGFETFADAVRRKLVREIAGLGPRRYAALAPPRRP